MLLYLLLVAAGRVTGGTASNLGPDVVDKRRQHPVGTGVADHLVGQLRADRLGFRLRDQFGIIDRCSNPCSERLVLLPPYLFSHEARLFQAAADELENP